MNPKIKKLLLDLLILIVPVLIVLLLTPVLPEKIRIYRGRNNRYIGRHYAFLGFLPLVICKQKATEK